MSNMKEKRKVKREIHHDHQKSSSSDGGLLLLFLLEGWPARSGSDAELVSEYSRMIDTGPLLAVNLGGVGDTGDEDD